MTNTLKSAISKILKLKYSNDTTGRVLEGTPYKLFYEKAQHLLFMFQKILRYEPILQRKLPNYIKKGDLVFDIGANIGQYSLVLSHIVGENGKIISLEPDHKNWSFLQFNININNITNVLCLNTGLDKVASSLKFYRDTLTGGRKGSFKKEFVEENFEGFVEEVDTITLDILIDKYGTPNFIKVDVEGYEVNVLNGLTYILNDTVFFIEVRKETSLEVYNYFKSRGYQCFCIDNEKDITIIDPAMIPSFANLLFKI